MAYDSMQLFQYPCGYGTGKSFIDFYFSSEYGATLNPPYYGLCGLSNFWWMRS